MIDILLGTDKDLRYVKNKMAASTKQYNNSETFLPSHFKCVSFILHSNCQKFINTILIDNYYKTFITS